MPEEETTTTFFADINSKLADLEEKQTLLRERVVALGENFLKTRENTNKEFVLLKETIRELKADIARIKESIGHILDELDSFAKKAELEILERFMKTWEPLKFAREEDVRAIVKEELQKLKEKENDGEEKY